MSFLELGDFIEGVKISKSRRYYEGIDKQDLISATLEHMTRERKNSSLRELSIKEVHKKIREVAESIEFRDLDYYTNFFSKNDKVQKCLNY